MNIATASIFVRFRRPLKIGEPVVITASITKRRRNLMEGEAKMTLKDGTLVAEGTSTMVILSKVQEEETHQSDDNKHS